jgi:two-component system, chemotaxis family, CheB/CheR fusion protein
MKSLEHVEEEAASAPSRLVVGVGASAGGLESIEKLFRALPNQTGMSFVVVQHLSPDYKSLMDELMSRYTGLGVVRAAHDMVVEADHVYLLPPGKEIEVRGGRLVLFDKVPRSGLSFPVDRFLTSLAEDSGTNAIAIILSGSGTDGSRGVRKIHQAGGMVLVEEPTAARFDGMPLAALEAGVVDIVLPAEALGRALMEHRANTVSDEASKAVEPSLKILRHAFGLDFSEYKRSTVLRRMQRRLALRQIDDIHAYNSLIASDRAEARALCHDLLIGVTCFFRDVSCFERLEREIVPRLVAEAVPEDREVRLWVAGCASGEEAYSMAILLHEAIEADGRGGRARVFATDVHSDALDYAGQGAYPQDRLKNVSPSRLERYFRARRDGTFQVDQALRQMVVFARHNVLRDAPFTNLDQVSCRNLLIYFKPQAQRRTLALLHYGLRVGGVLMLGSSESTGELGADFETLDEHARLYVKRQHTRLPSDLYVAMRADRAPPRAATRPPVSESPSIALYDAVLDRFMPPSFLVGEARDLIDCFSAAEDLLRLNPRRPSTDILDLVPEGVRVPLSGALARSARDPAPVRFNGIEWPVGDKVKRFDVCVERVTPRGRRTHCYIVRLLSGQPVVETPTEPVAYEELSRERFDVMEHELRQTRENLQSTIEELETSNEELQATNEELVASNEELQSTNEELHSVNEELHTVNAEYQSKFSELKELNRDIRHLFEAIDVATVFLDNELRIRKFTPRAATLFSLLPHDVGRRFSSFNHPLQYPELNADVESIVRGAGRMEREVRDDKDRCYLARLLPYGDGDEVSGVVLTLVDITVLAAARRRLELLSAIVDSSEDAIIGVDLDGRINAWNQGAVRMYGWEAEEILGDSIHLLIPSGRREEYDDIIDRILDEQRVENQWTQRRHRTGELLDVSVSISAVRGADGEIVGVSKIDRDIRDRKRLEQRLRENERKFEDLYHNSPDMYLSIDARTGRVLECNATWLATTGFTLEEAVDLHVTDLYTEDCQNRARKAFEAFRKEGIVRDVELVLRCKDGSRVDVSLNETSVRGDDGQILRSRSVLRDITTRKRAEHLILDAARVREQFLAMVSHELRNPLHAVRSAVTVLEAAAGEDDCDNALRVIRRQSDLMTRLVDDLLDVARITAGRLELRRGHVDLSQSARDAAEALASAFLAKRVELVCVGIDQPLPMSGDAARLQQVFANLLSNALRHTPEDSEVRLEIAADEGEGRVRATVRDRGRGIDAADVERIFELFAQGEQGLARQSGGLGLGLTLVRRIVDAHGGSVVGGNREDGPGAVFTVDLPRVQSTQTERAASRSRAGRRIVLVEDQDDARTMMKLLLEMDGHEVLEAEDGAVAVTCIEQAQPDVAIVDIGLPGMDGYEVARQVRELVGDSVRLIALTGYGRPEDIERSVAAGFDQHLTKPLDQEQLRRALR